jgi:hypothetical protein
LLRAGSTLPSYLGIIEPSKAAASSGSYITTVVEDLLVEFFAALKD